MKITLWNVICNSYVLTVSNVTLRIMDYVIERIRSDKQIKLIIPFLAILTFCLLFSPLFISIFLGYQYVFIGTLITAYIYQYVFIGTLITAYMFHKFIETPFEEVRNLLNCYDYLVTRCFKNLFKKRTLATFKFENGTIKRRQIRNLTMIEISEDFLMNNRMEKWLD